MSSDSDSVSEQNETFVEENDQQEEKEHDDSEEIKYPASREDLANMTLGEVQALRSKLGIKEFNKRYGIKREAPTKGTSLSKTAKKSMPMEISSKKLALKQNPSAASVPKAKVTRDPRFDNLSGEFNSSAFENSYKFVEKIKKKEHKQLKRIVEDEQMDAETRAKAKDLLTRLSQKKTAKEGLSAELKVEEMLKKERKEAIKDGRKPYFVKSAMKKKLVLAEKYKELKGTGQLEAFMSKKRKKNSVKQKPGEL